MLENSIFSIGRDGGLEIPHKPVHMADPGIDKNFDVIVRLNRIRELMKHPVLFDGRNIYEPEKIRSLGFKYRAFGRGYNGHALEANFEKEVVAEPA